MEREVASSVHIGVGLTMLAALLSLVIFTVRIGNTIKVSAFEKTTDVSYSVEAGYLKNMINKNNIMPAAAAYALFQKNRDMIVSTDCKICGEKLTGYEAGDCIATHMNGKVSLEIKKTSAELYEIIIHGENCTWETLGCND